MSFDSTIVCISYRDPVLLAVVAACSIVWFFAGVYLSRTIARRLAAGRSILALGLPVSVLLVALSPLAVGALVQGIASLSSRNVWICLHFVGSMLYLPGALGAGAMLVGSLARRRHSASAKVGSGLA